MEPERWVAYEERLDAVLGHIHDHMDQPLDLIRLAEVAGLSPRYWHRIFTAAFGESPSLVVRRVRMQHASAQLANTTRPVAEIAAEVGYPDVSSFGRAFLTEHGVPPARFRAEGSHTRFRLARREGDPDAFDVRIEDRPPIDCLGVRHRGPFLRIDQAFADLRMWYAARGHPVRAGDHIGVFLSDPTRTDEEGLVSVACLPRPPGVDDPTLIAPGAATVEPRTWAGGRHAVLTHVGPYAQMPDAYDWLFGCWVPRSGHALGDEPVAERYLSPPGTPPPRITTEIWLPLA